MCRALATVGAAGGHASRMRDIGIPCATTLASRVKGTRRQRNDVESRSLRIAVVSLAATAVVLGPSLAGAWARPATAGPGTWQRLSPAPIEPDNAVSVWTGKRLLVFGRVTRRAANGAVLSRVDGVS